MKIKPSEETREEDSEEEVFEEEIEGEDPLRKEEIRSVNKEKLILGPLNCKQVESHWGKTRSNGVWWCINTQPASK